MAISREVKVGAFVLAGLIVVGFVVFLIGDERRLFEKRVDFHAVFEHVQGLKPGSPVRMGGVDVGRVGKVAYSDDPHDARLHVVLEIVEAESKRVRKDSRTHIADKGLLGDKMIEVTVGSPKEPALAPGSTIPSEQTKDLSKMLEKLGAIGDRADSVMQNLEKATGLIAEQKFREDVQEGVHSLSSILRNVDEGDGYVGRLLRDPEEAEKLSRAVANMERTSAEMQETMASINRVVRQVETGPGLAHEVLYGEDGKRVVGQFGRAADELATTLQGVREGNGIAHSVIYGDDKSAAMMTDLNDMARDLRVIVGDVKQGKGTIGALLVDPSVYEDLKLLLGNVERNKALRALVRYSIQKDEKAPSVEIRDPGPVSTGVSGGARLSSQEAAGEGSP